MTYPITDTEREWVTERQEYPYLDHDAGMAQVRARATALHRKKRNKRQGADGETQREIVELRTLVGNLTDVLAKLLRDFNQQRVDDTTILDKTLASLETTAPPRKEISISKSVVEMLSSDY